MLFEAQTMWEEEIEIVSFFCGRLQQVESRIWSVKIAGRKMENKKMENEHMKSSAYGDIVTLSSVIGY